MCVVRQKHWLLWDFVQVFWTSRPKTLWPDIHQFQAWKIYYGCYEPSCLWRLSSWIKMWKRCQPFGVSTQTIQLKKKRQKTFDLTSFFFLMWTKTEVFILLSLPPSSLQIAGGHLASPIQPCAAGGEEQQHCADHLRWTHIKEPLHPYPADERQPE